LNPHWGSKNFLATGGFFWARCSCLWDKAGNLHSWHSILAKGRDPLSGLKGFCSLGRGGSSHPLFSTSLRCTTKIALHVTLGAGGNGEHRGAVVCHARLHQFSWLGCFSSCSKLQVANRGTGIDENSQRWRVRITLRPGVCNMTTDKPKLAETDGPHMYSKLFDCKQGLANIDETTWQRLIKTCSPLALLLEPFQYCRGYSGKFSVTQPGAP